MIQKRFTNLCFVYFKDFSVILMHLQWSKSFKFSCNYSNFNIRDYKTVESTMVERFEKSLKYYNLALIFIIIYLF